MKLTLQTLLFVLVLFISGCAQKNDHVVTISTKYGDMVAILYDETPKHKANFLKLARESYYDSLLFHRVIEGFMIQGGDPDSRTASPDQPLGSGGPNYTIEAEFTSYRHEKGALSAARLSDNQNPSKASSGSQFYIVHGKKFTEAELKFDQQKFNMAMQQFFQNAENKPAYDTIMGFYQTRNREAYEAYLQVLKPRIERETGINTDKDVTQETIDLYTTTGGAPHLDGQYTVFGKVIKGLEVIDQIASQPTSSNDRPVEDIRMTVRVEEMPRKKIEKEYGYKYPEKEKK
jgi:peptidyl-prolyl cis-trans isomerase B (cyclophilin B)